MIDVLIVFGFTAFFIFIFLREFRNTLRDRKLSIITTALVKMEKNKQQDNKWIPIDDNNEIIEENQEEEADEGDDDAILGI